MTPAPAIATPDLQEQEIFARWKSELDLAQKDEKYKDWLDRSEKIVKRYRDERKYGQLGQRKFNILWSNVQTLQPAVYGKMPKPIVERRFMDRDPAARLASTILERCLSFQMEVGYYHQSTSRCVLDYLLPGMGQTWLRYEPQFEAAEEAEENAEVEAEVGKSAEDIEEEGDGEPYQKLAYERVCVDYVYYRDFLWGPARNWQEVPWVGKRCWMTHSEIAEKFYDDDLQKAKQIVLDYTPDRMKDRNEDDKTLSFFKKAEIWEFWNKADRTVYIIAPGTPGLVIKQEKNPVLDLEGFWPCPEPLFTTQSNDTIVPVPDFVEYQDQAMELDDLTNRISVITTAVRANGVYDSSVPALARLLQEGTDNKLIPVDQWAMFAEKGGMKGAVDLLPMQEIIEVLIRLYEARAQVKTDLYEITGISDIVRGQSSGGAKTATEQRIKGQFGSMRLNSRQEAVARFCRDTLRINAEIISEMFSDQSLIEMSGYDQTVRDEVRKAVEAVPPPPPPEQIAQQIEQQAQQSGMPVDPMLMQGAIQQAVQQAQMAFQQAQQQAEQQATEKAMGEFQAAVAILRSDKLRGFRVDIETDSTIAADAEADKASAVELFQGTMMGIQAIAPVAAAAPELVEPLGDLLMFTYRRFRVGRSMESKLEEALVKVSERLEQMAANPPPNPEQVKAEAEIEKQKMETQRAQEEFQMEMQAKQADLEIQREKNAMEIEKMQAELEIEKQRLELERQKMGMEAIAAQNDAAIKAEGQQMQLEGQRQQNDMQREADEHKFQLNQQTMEAKAQAAQQQAKAKPNGAAK
jgi:hypothetical protein